MAPFCPEPSPITDSMQDSIRAGVRCRETLEIEPTKYGVRRRICPVQCTPPRPSTASLASISSPPPFLLLHLHLHLHLCLNYMYLLLLLLLLLALIYWLPSLSSSSSRATAPPSPSLPSSGIGCASLIPFLLSFEFAPPPLIHPSIFSRRSLMRFHW